MGNGAATKEEVEARLQAGDAACKQEWELSKTRLATLDARTRVPHLLIEVRSLGFVEIQGKDTGGIYQKLDDWLVRNWRAKKLEREFAEVANDSEDCGCCGFSTHYELHALQDYRRLCDMSYTLGSLGENGVPFGNGIFQNRGNAGENNMGKLTMQLAEFMTKECGWTFQVCDSGNLGFRGEVREHQMMFKAPHPLNLIAPLIMVELRQVGYIEINGPDVAGIYGKLTSFAASKWKARQVQADAAYCDLKFSTRAFQSRGTEGENNMGLRTMELVDFMVKECQWTMVTCNTGKYGTEGTQREQQLVFRNDEFVQHGVDHIMVELRTVGYIEINGLHDAADLQPQLANFLETRWGCRPYTPYLCGAKYCDLKYTCPEGFYYKNKLTNNLGKRTLELADILAEHGWALLLCNGGSVRPSNNPNSIIREQQVKFTRVTSGNKAKEALLMIELRTQPTNDSPIQYEQFIEVCGKNTNNIYQHLQRFFTENMRAQYRGQASHCDALYTCGCFRLSPSSLDENRRCGGYLNGQSNLGKWTMRICDFMVDHIGEWDLIVCNSDNLSRSFQYGRGDNQSYNSVTAREMHMVFRHRSQGRAVFMSAETAHPLGRAPKQPPPYWTDPGCTAGTVGHRLVNGTPVELEWMQEIFDKTFKQNVTRDRTDGEPLADRFVAVQCIRSEHPGLWDRFAERRQAVSRTCKEAAGAIENFVVPKTAAACEGLASRCVHVSVGNPANQAYLLHGTNPTSAVAILSSSFRVNLAGSSAGTMFGPGVYLAESATKADEYARDDVGGEYDGLYAVILCRVVLGRSLVVEKPGDYTKRVTSGEFDHVLGDREKAVGTFREFVLFHEESIYPEYAVFYRRERGGVVLHPASPTEAPPLKEMREA